MAAPVNKTIFCPPPVAYLCLLLQYMFLCLRNSQIPHLTMVHHTTISKYQEEQGRMCSQGYKTRSLSRPPPLPLKKVRVQRQLSSFINRAAPLSLSPHHSCSSTRLRTLAHLKHAVQHNVDNLRFTPLLAFTVVYIQKHVTHLLH